MILLTKPLKLLPPIMILFNTKKRNNFDQDYNAAFETIDSAIRNIANKVFYIYGPDSFNHAYDSFRNYNYVQAVRGRLHKDFLK